MKRTLYLFAFLLLLVSGLRAQSLSAGDIAFIGYREDTPDGFTFVALEDIPAGEVIYFTDQGWSDADNDWYANNEAHFSWTAPAGGVSKGTIITAAENTSNNLTANVGSFALASDPTSSFSLPVSGDALLAYQSTAGAEAAAGNLTFLAGIYWDDNYAHNTGCDGVQWFNTSGTCLSSPDSPPTAGGTSGLPPGLTNGVNAIHFFPPPTLEGASNNGRYVGAQTGDKVTLSAEIANPSNWEFVDGVLDITTSYYTTSFTVNPLAGSSLQNMYWTDNIGDKIRRSNLDGSNIQEIVTSADGLSAPSSIVVDSAGGKVYWCDLGTDKIQRSDLDGNNIEDLVTTTDLGGASWNPSGLSIDFNAGKMYWTDNIGDKIRRSNLDGSSIQELITSADGLSAPNAIVVNVSEAKLYWCDLGTDKIQRSNLDGSNIEDLVTTTDLGGVSWNPSGLAIDFSAGKMYWTDNMGDKIRRSNLNGSSIQELITSADGLSAPNAIFVKENDAKIYWCDLGTDKIQRSNLDGSNIEDIVTTTDLGGASWNPSGLSLFSTVSTVACSMTASITSQTNVACNGNSTGSLTASPASGASPYTYSWSNGATTSSITGISAGTYTVTVTDDNGCTSTASATVTEPTALTASTTLDKNVSCNGGSDGELTGSGSGGASPYTYSWSNGGTTASQVSLPAGTYTVTITDNNGCTATSSKTITSPAALDAGEIQ